MLAPYSRTVFANPTMAVNHRSGAYYNCFGAKRITMKLKQTIFGPETLVAPNSRTNINQLHNMIMLSPEIHGHWGLGDFMLGPVEEAMNSYEQSLRFKWVPQWRSSGSINCPQIQTASST